MKKPLVCVIYDSISQAITESQIVVPLIKRATEHEHDQIILISFEKQITEKIQVTAKKISQSYPLITCILFKRPPFLGKLFLWQQAIQLKNFLDSIHTTYTLIARGPFAALIAKKGITNKCLCLIVQARGAAFQEYLYTTTHKNKIPQLPSLLRATYLYALERSAYSPLKSHIADFFVESVSPALSTYLQTTYQTSASFIPALFDLPLSVPNEKRQSYRTVFRIKLAIHEQAVVYAYNGSLQPWQCPEKTLQFFKEQWKKNNNLVLLALTPDTQIMESYLQKFDIPDSAYRILHLPHQDIIPALCAADYGILFREQHLMNWVSRPTKALEYQAAGLTIIHNDTIHFLISQSDKPAKICI